MIAASLPLSTSFPPVPPNGCIGGDDIGGGLDAGQPEQPEQSQLYGNAESISHVYVGCIEMKSLQLCPSIGHMGHAPGGDIGGAGGAAGGTVQKHPVQSQLYGKPERRWQSSCSPNWLEDMLIAWSQVCPIKLQTGHPCRGTAGGTGGAGGVVGGTMHEHPAQSHMYGYAERIWQLKLPLLTAII